MSSSGLSRLISRNVRFVLKETNRRNNALLYRSVNRLIGTAENDKNDDDDKKEKENPKYSETMDAFLKLEVQLAKKRKARQILENKQSGKDVEDENKEYTVKIKPEEPGPNECCGNDCANCVWKDYAEQMVEYEAYINATKS